MIPYSPLAGGWLSGKYTTESTGVEENSRTKGNAEKFDTPEGRARLEKADALV